MTQLEYARRGLITREMREAAQHEGMDVETLRTMVADGVAVLPANRFHANLEPLAIGKGLRTKVNANVGTSGDYPDTESEIAKARAALEAGADALMDLSTGEDLDATRRAIVELSNRPVGTVPVYQAMVEAAEGRGAMVAMTEDELFDVIEKQARDGVDFMTVHCGVTREALERIRRSPRVMGIVSRGGAFMAAWMLHHDRENPLYAQYDRLLEIAGRYDVTLSLGDGLRPGCIEDATDRPQIQELVILGELVERAREANVQVMVEGPGHVSLDQVAANVVLQKRLCKDAPFYVLGPLVTDVAPGYDHITSAIGGAVAAMAGADFLCYVTPSEHLGLPTLEQVREGVIAARIAAHAADLARGSRAAREWDRNMANARARLDWDSQVRLAICPDVADRHRRARNREGHETCSMCGKYCAVKIVAEYMGRRTEASCR